MSIKLMSAIFDVEMHDLNFVHTTTHKDGTVDDVNSVVRASTAKFVLIALADHANDYGEGAYPGISRLEKKTDLSRQAVIDALEALQKNGLITVNGVSRLGTNDYTINIRSFPKMSDEAAQLPELVHPADRGSMPGVPELVHPADHNHHITINEPSTVNGRKKGDLVDALVDLYNTPGAKKSVIKEYIASQVKVRLAMNPSGKDAESFIDYAANRKIADGQEIDPFIDWWIANFTDRAYWSFKRMEQQWPAAFIAEPVETLPIQPEEDASLFVPAPGRK